MRYLVDNSFTSIPETTGTIQNIDTIFAAEISFNDASTTETALVTLYPRQMINFTNKTVRARCKEEGKRIELRVVTSIVRGVNSVWRLS